MQSTQTTLGRFPTLKASAYLQQLCKHFGHKVPVSHNKEHGEISFLVGSCVLEATGTELEIKVSANTVEDLERAKNIIDSHLERFAFREGFKTMDWS